MKKIILLILTLFFSIVGYSQFPTPGAEGFEGTTGADLPTPTTPSPWTLGTGATGNQWAVFDNGVGLSKRWTINTVAANVYQGVNAAFMDRENININNTSEDYLATPLVTVPTNGQLRFWTRSTISGPNGTEYLIKVNTNTTAGSQTTLANYTNTPAQWTEATLSATYNVYEEKVVDLSAFAGQQVYIAFVMRYSQPTSGLGGDRWLIDRVSLVQRCLEPTNLSATGITQTTADLNWTNPSGSTSWEIEVIPSVGGVQTGVGVVYNGALPYIASGLSPNTCYVYYVRSLCTDGSSNWVGPFNFCTVPPGLTCVAPITITTLPYSTNDNTANYGDSTDTAQPAACAGTTANYMTGNDVFYSYTPATSGTISITMTPNDNWSGIFVYQGCANVGVTCVAGVANNGGGVRSIPSLSVTAGLPYIIVISTNATPQTVGYNLLIQEVNCPQPDNLAASSIGQTSATLTWGNPGGATSWEIVVQLQNTGIPLGVGNTINTNTSHVETGLTQATAYEYYVRADCGNGTFSAWSGPFLFNTNICDVSQQCNYTFRLTDTFGDGWNGNTMSVRQNGIEVALLGPTFTAGAGPINITVPMCDGLPFELFWNNGGAFAGEVGVSIINSFNQTIYTKAAGTGTQNSSLYTGTVNCLTPACLPPTNLVATNLSQTSATLGWTTTGPETSWEIIVLPANSPAPLPNNPLWSSAPTNPFTVGGLTSGTSYEFYVRPLCSPTNIGDPAGPKRFDTTICDPVNQCIYTFTMTDTFGDGWNGNTMNVIQNGIVIATIGTTFTAGNGPITVQVPLCNALPVELFWNAGGAFANEVGVSITNSFSQVIYTKAPGTGAQNTSLYTGTVNCLVPSCLPPTNLVATNLSQTSATLGWTTTGPETSWEIVVLPFPSVTPPANSLLWTAAPTNPFTFNGLTSGTRYDFYVRPICSPTNTGDPSLAGTFNTTICPPTDQCLYTFTMTDTFGDGWNGNTMSVLQNGIVVGTFGATFTNGNGPVSVQIPLCHGIAFQLQWNTGGAFANEVGVSIQEALAPQATIYTKAPGTGAQGTTLYNGTGECFLPTCPKPISLTATSVTQTSAVLSWTEQGTATSWEIFIVPVGSPAPLPNSLGIVTTNPYTLNNLPPGTAYTFYVRAICSPTDSSLWSQPLTFGTLPVNDECANATFAIVNQNLNCVQTTPGTLVGATQSLPAVNCPPGVANDDVWYTFTATAATHIISFNNVLPVGTNLDYAIFTGNNCGALTQINCNAADGLTAGVTYYLRVYSASAQEQLVDFDLCIGTLPCTEAPAFCTGQTVTYANSTNVPSLGQIGCLFTSPNPAFFFLQVNQAGPLTYLISQVDNNGIGRDVDYVAWGPFTDLQTACSGVPQNPLPGIIPAPTPAAGCPGTLHACSYSAAPTEIMCIPNAQLCEVYVIMITNFSNQSGNVTFTQTNSGGGTTACFPINTFNYPQTTYCQDGVDPTPVLAPGASAGTYTSTTGLVIDSVTGTVDLSASTPGAYIVTSSTATTVGGPCNTIPFITTTRTIIITAPASATISYSNASYCNTITALQTVTRTGTVGGTYSASPSGLSIDPITGNFVPSASVPNTYTITYSVPASGGCAAFSTTTQVVIIPATVPTFTQVAPICPGDVLADLPTTSNNGVTGTWSPAMNNTTTTTYTFTPTSGLCATTATMTIGVGSTTPTFTQVSPICPGAPLANLPTTSNNGVVGTWSPVMNNTATTTYTFTPNAGICAGTVTMTIVVNTPSIVPTFTPVAPICIGATLSALPTTSNNGITGTWSPALDNTATTTYTFTPDTGQCALVTTLTIIVNPNLVVTVNNPTVCAGSSATVTATPAVPGNYSYTWTVPALASNPGNVASFSTTIAGTYSVVINQVTNFCNTDFESPTATGAFPNLINENLVPCWDTTSTDGIIEIWPPGFEGVLAYSGNQLIELNGNTPGTLFQDFSVLPGTALTISFAHRGRQGNDVVGVEIGPLGGPYVSLGTFTDNNTAWVLHTVNYVVPTTGGNNYTLRFVSISSAGGSPSIGNLLDSISISSLSCPSQPTSGVVTITTPDTPTFTAIPDICLNGTAPTLPTTSNNGIAGTWSPNTVDTTVVGTTTYTFTPNLGICATTATLNVTIINQVTPTFNSIAAICQNSVAPTLPLTSLNGIIGTWSPATINTSVAGPVTYTFTPDAIPSQACALTTTLSVTIDPQVVTTFNSIANICQNGVAPSLSSTSNEGITGTWSPSIIDTTVAGTVTYTFTPTAGICATTATLSVTIDAPTVPIFTQIASICLNGTAPTLPSSSNNGGIAGTWSPTSINTSAVGNTTYTFTPNAGLCATTTTMVITINPQTTPLFTQIGPLCQGSVAPTLSGTSTNGISGTWSPSVIDTANSGTFTYSFTPNAGLCATTTTMTIVINFTPVISPISSVSACNSYTLPNLAVGNYYTGTNGTGSIVNAGTVITSTTMLYVYSANGSCTDQESFTITITPAPSFTLTGGCVGTNYVLEVMANNFDSSLATYLWTGPTGVVGTNSSTLQVPANAAGNYSCTVTIPNGTGTGTCSDTEVFVANDVTCSIPRGISPNGDTLNDTFDLTGLNVKVLSIYNRYGTKVYSKTNYVNEWGGQSDAGNELPDGTYYYVIERNGVDAKSGWVYINRETK
jgi:gliding motility-associated-like protein